jgi:hypothetical protein
MRLQTILLFAVVSVLSQQSSGGSVTFADGRTVPFDRALNHSFSYGVSLSEVSDPKKPFVEFPSMTRCQVKKITFHQMDPSSVQQLAAVSGNCNSAFCLWRLADVELTDGRTLSKVFLFLSFFTVIGNSSGKERQIYRLDDFRLSGASFDQPCS